MNHTFKIILACTGVFILQKLLGQLFFENFALIQETVLLKPWMVVSALFLHGDFSHLLLNMVSLAIFGSILEHVIGRRRFLYVFFGTGILANIISVPFYTAALGASGAILGIMGTLAVLRPQLVLYVYFFPMRLWFAVILYAVIDIFGIFIPNGVGNIAHLAGLVVGLFIGWHYLKTYGKKRARYQPIRMEDAVLDRWEDQYMQHRR